MKTFREEFEPSKFTESPKHIEDGTIVGDSIPSNIIQEILGFIEFRGSNWLHMKLVSKSWKKVADKVFDPNKLKAFKRLIAKKRLNSLARLLDTRD